MKIMHSYTVLFALTVCFSQGITKNIGRFWHVTDFHYDQTYWTGGLSCNADVSDPGTYGHTWCDSPWLLVQNTVDNMVHICEDVDFVLWTGDSVAHIDDEYLSLDLTIEIIQNVTTALSVGFQGVPIYPTLGNRDFLPSSQAPPEEEAIYRRVAEMWEAWIISQNQIELFKEGGYYSTLLQPKLRLLALNTNLYYSADELTETIDDPAGQLQWMKSQFEEARGRGEKVIIAGHVPPGLQTPEFRAWFYPKYQSTFVDSLTEYSDVIVATYFGHEHSDGFKILQKGTSAVPQFSAPSVTPWRSTTELDPPHNPGVRLVEYDRDTGKQLNYHQYYMNLTDSNASGQAKWSKLYSFTDAYTVADMGVTSLKQIFSRMEDGGGREVSTMYCNYARVSAFEQVCTDEFRAEIYCGGLIYDLKEAEECVEKYLQYL